MPTVSTGMAFFTEQRYFCSFVSNSTTRGSLSEGFLVDRHGLFYTTGFILSLGNVFCEQAYNKGFSLWVLVDRHGLSYRPASTGFLLRGVRGEVPPGQFRQVFCMFLSIA
jgi:hypothetical protein